MGGALISTRSPGTMPIAVPKPTLWVRNSRTPGDCTICTAMCGNGASIGMDPTPLNPPSIPKGLPRAGTVSFAAAVGVTRHSIVEPRAAAILPQTSTAMRLVSALSGAPWQGEEEGSHSLLSPPWRINEWVSEIGRLGGLAKTGGTHPLFV